MAIKAQDVKKLRDATGVGMMDCKKALVESDGDFDKAIEILRTKGEKVAAKRADRDASEGAIVAATTDNGSAGILVEVNSETDFVARNSDFTDLRAEDRRRALGRSPCRPRGRSGCQDRRHSAL